jgi:serine phosphatase RsbU (regulator of sigma subunit)
MGSNIFKGYYRIVFISFTVIFLIAGLMAFWQFKSRVDYEEKSIHNQFQQFLATTNQIIANVNSNANIMRAKAHFILQKPEIHPIHPLTAYIKNQTKERYFFLDSLPQNLSKEETGNLTGIGQIESLTEKQKKQIQLALYLNPLTVFTYKTSPNVVLTYYLGDTLGILYPFIAAKDFHVNEKTMTNSVKVYPKRSLEKNPQQNMQWSAAYMDETGKGLMVSAYIPVFWQKEDFGVIGLDVTLDSLNQIIAKSQREFGEIFIINEEKQLLAHPKLVSSKNKVAKLLKDALPAELKDKVIDLQQLTKNKLLEINGYFIYYENIPLTSWQLVYVVNTWQTYEKIFADIGLGLLFILLSVTAILLVTAVYTQRRFIEPAGKLVKHIQNEQLNAKRQNFKVPQIWQSWFTVIDQIFDSNRLLINELRESNEHLEERVKQRTIELQEKQDEVLAQNEELMQNQEEILAQRDFITKMNKELVQRDRQITSSIKAAYTIQQAVLPYKLKLDTLLKDYFVINKPKDVVSGDFFWLNQLENYTFLIVADCTGHGVPGAFMTLIGDVLLDKIIRIWKIYEPNQILMRLNEEVRTVLHQEETGSNNGMDVAVLRVENSENGKWITFAGAKRPLHYIDSDGEVVEIRGNRYSIGGRLNDQISFNNYSINLPIGTLIYLGSDGFIDQNDKHRKKLGELKFKSLLTQNQHLSLYEQKESLLEALTEQMRDTTQRDDILLIGFRL